MILKSYFATGVLASMITFADNSTKDNREIGEHIWVLDLCKMSCLEVFL